MISFVIQLNRFFLQLYLYLYDDDDIDDLFNYKINSYNNVYGKIIIGYIN